MMKDQYNKEWRAFFLLLVAELKKKTKSSSEHEQSLSNRVNNS